MSFKKVIHSVNLNASLFMSESAEEQALGIKLDSISNSNCDWQALAVGQ